MENIRKSAFSKLVKFKYSIHQIVFCTEDALKKLHFEGRVDVTEVDDELVTIIVVRIMNRYM